MILTSEDLRAERARRSLHWFVKEFWPVIEPFPFIDAWHIGYTCEVLQDVQTRKIRKLALCKPPGTSKSRILSVMFPAWDWLIEPKERHLFASYNLSLLIHPQNGFSALTRRIIQSEKFQRWYPNRVILAGDGQQEFATLAGGLRYSTTCPRGPVTGKHGTRRFIDDPIKPDDVTKAMLEEVNGWFGDTWNSRDIGNPTDVVSMQRLAYNDLVEECVTRRGFQLVSIPMEYERAYSIPGDPRTVEGESLDPVRFPPEKLADRKVGMSPNDWAAQYQQRPTPDGGAIFRKDWFQSWSGVISDLPEGGAWIHSWDCAFKDEDDSDFVVGQVWYVAGAHCYLVDQVRGRMSFPDTVAAVLKLKNQYRADRILIEDKANGPAVIATIHKMVPCVIAVNPDGGKVSRANATTGMLQALQVFFPTGADWFLGLLQEALRFPRGKNDDQVDAMTQALNYVKQNYTDLAALSKGLRDPETIGILLGLDF